MGLNKATPTGRERYLGEDEIIVSKTDTTGRITYVNQTFLTISDFKEHEVVGAPHSILRHPEMPRCIFKLLWDTIKSGQEVFAYVCNLTKYGDHYWVFAHVTPTFDANEQIIGFHSNRRAPERSKLEQVIRLYREILEEEKRHSDRNTGLSQSAGLLTSVVKEKASAYDEFIFSI